LLGLYSWLHTLPGSARQAKLEELWQLAGGRQSAPTLLLTEDELRRLASSRWIEIGSHTMTHPPLDKITPAEQAHEICASRAALERLVGQPVRSLSYPHGCHTLDTVELARGAGYCLACVSFSNVVWSKSDRYRLPRVWARNKPPARFSDGWIAPTPASLNVHLRSAALC
jgi:peptidoglycan/xylan/chitin deacetylase (PgdA/CDA1 family)